MNDLSRPAVRDLSNLRSTPNLVAPAVFGGYCVVTFGILLTSRRPAAA